MALPTSFGKIPEVTNSAIAPARTAEPMTKSNTTIQCFRALYVGGAGDVTIRTLDGSTTTFVGVPAGQILPVCGDKLMSTNTTATNVVGFY